MKSLFQMDLMLFAEQVARIDEKISLKEKLTENETKIWTIHKKQQKKALIVLEGYLKGTYGFKKEIADFTSQYFKEKGKSKFNTLLQKINIDGNGNLKADDVSIKTLRIICILSLSFLIENDCISNFKNTNST